MIPSKIKNNRLLPKIIKKFNEKYLQKLTKRERRLFINNCKDSLGDKTMYFVYIEPVNHISIFIGGFFDWHETPEGYNYWDNLHNKYVKKQVKN